MTKNWFIVLGFIFTWLAIWLLTYMIIHRSKINANAHILEVDPVYFSSVTKDYLEIYLC